LEEEIIMPESPETQENPQPLEPEDLNYEDLSPEELELPDYYPPPPRPREDRRPIQK
jgi:hypothetical protein